jgi:hypothetical protein
MATLPLADCARQLGIHPKTLHNWLTQANIPFAAHPTDARIKCLAEEYLLEVAKLHDRPLQPLASPALRDASSSQSAPQRQMRPSPSKGIEPPQTASFQLSPCMSEADLIQKLSCLETKVVTLQEQLAQLALALLQEREQSVERRITALESLLQPIGGKQRLPDLPAIGARQEPRRLNSAEQRARSRMPALIEYGAQETYVIISSQEGELHIIPDSPEWFDWLATLSSFRFVGQQGCFTAYRHSHSSRSWRAHRSIHQRSYKQTLGVTDHLTILRLEQGAAALQSHMASLSLFEQFHANVFVLLQTSATVVFLAPLTHSWLSFPHLFPRFDRLIRWIATPSHCRLFPLERRSTTLVVDHLGIAHTRLSQLSR